ncbi:hypothetical protein NX059_012044 [Plenodomus lindquistii]|nr:hypothetical protein NX059_012044 [Plenodomus lindquistii]
MALITSRSTADPSSSKSPETIPRYEYKPLRDRQIRVFKLGAGSHYKHITGSLQHVNLDGNPKYEALSYEWGNPEKKHKVLLKTDSGQLRSIEVTQSLYTALRDLRHWSVWSGDRIIWADALCINQDDIEERQKQVAMMGDVYRNASRSITYIGPACENTASGIETMKKLVDAFDSDAPREELNTLVGDTADAIKDLLTRGWAGRSWCVQEFILNRNLVILCGSFEVPSEIFYSLLSFLLIPSSAVPDNLVWIGNNEARTLAASTFNLCFLRAKFYNDSDFFFFNLLLFTWPTRASDPRDKIYSLLGLASDAKNLNIDVDYTCDVTELFTKVTGRIVQQHKGIALLSFITSIKSLDLPSWVPDWSVGTANLLYSHEAATSKSACVKVSDERVLQVRGCVIDRVNYVSEPINNAILSIENLDKRTRGLSSSDDWICGEERLTAVWLDGLIARVRRLLPYPGGLSEREVVWRTLICNFDSHRKLAPLEYEAKFEALRDFIESPTQLTMGAREEALEFLRLVQLRLASRLCTTQKKYFGAVIEETQEGDVVCLLEGASCLFILRVAGDNKYKLIGPAYVHGLMHGEAFEMEDYESTDILIV